MSYTFLTYMQGRARFRNEIQFMHASFGKPLLYDFRFLHHAWVLSEVSWSWAHFIKCVWNLLCLEFELFEFCFPCRSKKCCGPLYPSVRFYSNRLSLSLYFGSSIRVKQRSALLPYACTETRTYWYMGLASFPCISILTGSPAFVNVFLDVFTIYSGFIFHLYVHYTPYYITQFVSVDSADTFMISF